MSVETRSSQPTTDTLPTLAQERSTTPRSEGGGIRVRDLNKTYAGGVKALHDVSFDVHPGEAFGLLGPNGAGKSTTIGILTTTVRPTSGEVLVGGFDVSREPIAARRASGIVFQESVLDAALTGRANLELHARLWRVPRDRARKRMTELVDAMGLAGVIDRPTRTFSGGERRRLEIARAVLGDPRVLFLDEPTVGLDPSIRQELWSLIRDLRSERGMTLVLTTHYLDEAERLCDRIAIMHVGRIVAMDSPANLLAALGDEILEVEVAGDPAGVVAVLQKGGIPSDDALQIGSLLTVPLRNGQGDLATRRLREATIELRSVALRRPTLDDVYLRLTGAKLDA